MKVVISLNGSVFTEWKKGSRLLSIFLKFINRADVVTVVGAKHRQTLLQFGVAPNKVIVVGNPCTLPIIESEEVTAKQLKAAPGQTINLLHLSLLIESKGFPEYLEALEILAERQMDTRINAVLCGPLSFTAYCTRFTSVESKRKWIVSKVESINLKGNGKVRVDWIEGARGEMKQKLFRDAHIFILPTYFPVEAQPLVLLEALASGAAVITSTAGEIPSTLNNASATMLSDLSPAAIANEIVRLTEDTQARLKMALTGNELVRSAFSLEHYATTWENIFNKLTEPKK